MEYSLSGEEALTPEARNLLIRYAVSVAERGTCATKVLLRPFRQKYLKEAFFEKREKLLAAVSECKKKCDDYDPETTQSPARLSERFGGMPTKEQYAKLCAAQIADLKRTLRELRRNYCVCVDFGFVGKELLAFHASLHPRMTFGYSNWLHEACDFIFDEETRVAFLGALSPDLAGGAYDWGYVVFGQAQLIYEDLALFRNGVCILETVTHEEMMTLRFEERDLIEIAKLAGGETLPKRLEQYRHDAV